MRSAERHRAHESETRAEGALQTAGGRERCPAIGLDWSDTVIGLCMKQREALDDEHR